MLKPDNSGAGSDQWFDFSDSFSDAGLQAILSQKADAHQHLDVAELRSRLIKTRGIDPAQLAIPHQVHSSHVEITRAGQIHPATDGLFTQDSTTALTLQVADCGPVYFNHPNSGWRGLVHAGWRGAASGIMAASIELLKQQDCQPVDLEVVIGICIDAASDDRPSIRSPSEQIA